MDWIYFDHASSTPMSQNALDVLARAHEKAFANSSAAHSLGRELNERLEAARSLILKSLGASEKNYRLTFTSSATEANNLVIRGLHESDNTPQLFVAGAADHPSLIQPILSRNHHILVQNGRDPEAAFTHASLEKPFLLCLSHVNNNSGQLLNLKALTAKVRPHCRYLHLDASQSFGKLPLYLNDKSFDSVAISAHKMGGPKGIAALIHRHDLPLQSALLGGDQENGIRSSTVPVALCLSWAQSIVDSRQQLQEKWLEALNWNKKIRTELSAEEVVFPFALEKTSPYILTIILKDLASDMVLRHLEKDKIIASTSSACSSKNKKFNESFSALGIDEKDHGSVLRISMGHSTTEDEVEKLISSIKKNIHELRTLLNKSR